MTTTILNLSYDSKLFNDSLRFVLTQLVDSPQTTCQAQFLGFTLRMVIFVEDYEFQLLYKNIFVTKISFPNDDNVPDVIDDAVYFFCEEIPKLTHKTCALCQTIYFSTNSKITHCVACISALCRLTIPESPSDASNKCCICLEELGAMNLGAFQCEKHLGHIMCISRYEKNHPNPQYSCPNRCEPIEDVVEIEFQIPQQMLDELNNENVQPDGREDNPR